MRHGRGFTIIELMVTLAVAAIVLTIAVPQFETLVKDSRATSVTNELVTALHLARSEAITKRDRVSVCASADQASCAGGVNWATGWIIFTDNDGTAGSVDSTGSDNDRVLQVWPAPGGNIALVGNVGFIQFQPIGTPNSSATLTLTPPECRGNRQRVIDVSAIGNVSTATNACP